MYCLIYEITVSCFVQSTVENTKDIQFTTDKEQTILSSEKQFDRKRILSFDMLFVSPIFLRNPSDI